MARREKPKIANRQPQVHEDPVLWEELDEADVVDVVVDIDAPDLQPTYTYRVPERLRDALAVGSCVHVPFGGQEKVGYVFGRRLLAASDPLARRLREVIAPIQGAVTFNAEQAAVALWIADRYVCDLVDAVRCIAPTAMASRIHTVARLAEPGISGRDAGDAMVQAHILEMLRALGGEAELDRLRDAAHVPAFNGSYAGLVKKGLVTELREVARARVVTRTVRAYELGPAAGALTGRISAAGRRILDALGEITRRGGVPALADELLREAGSSPSALKTLVDQGAVSIREVALRRAPQVLASDRTVPPTLSPGQGAAVAYLARALEETWMRDGRRTTDDGRRAADDKRSTTNNQWTVASSQRPNDLPTQRASVQHRPPNTEHRAPNAQHRTPNTEHRTPNTTLLFGVTASGKTEVYLDAIARTLAAGRSAMVLVPEIALTTQVVEVFTGRFGDEVAVLHSRLSEGERHDEWRRLQERRARIAVGARSAVFAPVEDVGLIVVDEEHEASYKQESAPRYHARDVAIERARLAGAAVVLGSATPALETYYSAEQGRIGRVEMRERIDRRALPEVRIVDLREEFRENRTLFSRELVHEMGERLLRQQQTILFLNRRGYAQFVLCRDCGYVARCPNCAVALTFHAAWGALKCHHCDYGRSAPSVCPECGGARVKGFGIGTERVEEEVLRHFPSARVSRLDRDTTARKGAHGAILRQFRQGETDILIGTQMVAKGLDFPNVTLVGVVSADTSINMPDFRAAERTFQLLTQVAGRAGRGQHPGTVIVQTFSPDHYSVQAAREQDYPAFYAREIRFREELRYPPFSRFANIVASAPISADARSRAEAFGTAVKSVAPGDFEVIGPAPAPLGRLKSMYRYHVVLRAPTDDRLSAVVRRALERLGTGERTGLTVDIDPMGMA